MGRKSCGMSMKVKDLAIAKKLKVWNEVVEKVNTDFEGNRKIHVFWSFVGRKTRGKEVLLFLHKKMRLELQWQV